MVIHNLDLIGVTFEPDKTNAPLFINANAALPLPIALQCFQSVPGQRRECPDVRRSVQQVQLPQGSPLDSLEAAHRFPLEKTFGIRAAKGTDHKFRLYCYPVNVNQ